MELQGLGGRPPFRCLASDERRASGEFPAFESYDHSEAPLSTRALRDKAPCLLNGENEQRENDAALGKRWGSLNKVEMIQAPKGKSLLGKFDTARHLEACETGGSNSLGEFARCCRDSLVIWT